MVTDILLFIAAWFGVAVLMWAGFVTLKARYRRHTLAVQTHDWILHADERQQVIVFHAMHAIDQRSAKGCKAGFSQGRDR